MNESHKHFAKRSQDKKTNKNLECVKFHSYEIPEIGIGKKTRQTFLKLGGWGQGRGRKQEKGGQECTTGRLSDKGLLETWKVTEKVLYLDFGRGL